MELNTEINKVFGTEMAKIFSQKISEEEILKQAKEVWNEMNRPERWNNQSEFQKIIKQEYVNILTANIKDVVKDDKFYANVRAEAETIVDEIKAETHKKIVEEISSRIAETTSGYEGYGIKNMIGAVVQSMVQR